MSHVRMRMMSKVSTSILRTFYVHHKTMSDKFSLKWNDFQSNVSSSFSLLRNEDYLHDVTIVTDDNEQVAAHKLVLSACSEYFKNIFKRNKHQNPHLCLEGVYSKDIRNVMDYIYNGEVQIFQDDLDRFLSIAQRLKLEGLLTVPKADPEGEEDIQGNEPRKIEDNHIREEITRYETAIKPNPSKRHEKIISKISTEINPDNISEVEEHVEQNIIRNLDGTYSCKICGKSSGKKISNMKNHIETHLEGLSFDCPMCEKTFRSRNSLAHHKIIHK